MSEIKQNLPDLLQEESDVYKSAEYVLMCEFIEDGLWRETNLSRAVGVSRNTIRKWKAYPKAQKAYRKAIKEVMKKRKKTGDVEKQMKELGLEVDNDTLNINFDFDDEQTQRIAERMVRSSS